MEMYKNASKLQLRFTTNKGLLSVEQLWTLNQTDLANAIKGVKKLLKESSADDELAFLENAVETEANTENKLRFDILKDVFITKQTENKAAREAAENKARDQKILEIIAKKKDQSLEDKSVEELEEMLSKK